MAMISPILSNLDTSTAINQHYVEILEKTNQQLNLLFNPYGIAIGILTVLIGILAIATAVIIYRQGSDYKKKIEQDRLRYQKTIEQFISEQKASIENFIDENKKKIDKVSENIDKFVIEYEKKLETASVEKKKEIEEAISNLKAEQIRLQTAEAYPLSKLSGLANLGTTVDFGAQTFKYNVPISGLPHFCSNCGKEFNYTYPAYTYTDSSKYEVKCPYCGYTNLI